jgi:hypothetical protein
MSRGQYEVFSYIVSALCVLAWVVMLGQLGSLVRHRAVFKKRIGAVGFALTWMIAFLIVAAANPVGVYKEERLVIGAVLILIVSGAFSYLTGRYIKD